MASSPTSLYSSVPGSKKRSALANTSSISKRRKHSSAGPSQLRQSTLPPENSGTIISPDTTSAAVRSPSVESSVVVDGRTPSLISGAGRGKKKKKKKKQKGRGDDAASATAGSSRAEGATGSASAADDAGEDDEDEEEDDLETEEARKNLTAEGGKMSQAAEKQAREHLAMLVDAFNPEQSDRYDVWRRVKLKRDSVRRLVNHTLSQSVPLPVVNTVSGCAKVMIGELVEKARDVQMEWQAAATELPTGEPVPDTAPISARTAAVNRGPLTPDHLREALRRYKKDITSGGAGFLGLSLRGPDNAAVRTGGRRLFK